MVFVTTSIRFVQQDFRRRCQYLYLLSFHKKQPYSVLSQDIELIATSLLLKSSTKQLSEITQLHSCIIKTGLENDSFALSKLLASSIKHPHHINYAESIFRDARNPNLYIYNTMLRGYSMSDVPHKAFVVFNELRVREVGLDEFSFIGVVKACSRVEGFSFGVGVHGVVVKCGGVGVSVNLKNTLLHFYGVCRRIEDAQRLFDEFPDGNDLVSWNTLMGGYLNVFMPDVAMALFGGMRNGGFVVGESTVLSVLSAVGGLGDGVVGECVHGLCVKIGFLGRLNVVTALIEMYAKAGRVEFGRRIFDGVVDRDVVIWNCLIDGYAKSGLLEESVALVDMMKVKGVKPNSSTLAGLLSACAATGALTLGRRINDYVEKEQLALDTVLGTALVDMYAKCGVLKKAVNIFNKIKFKDVKCWTAMISGYGNHGQTKNAIEYFSMMEEQGFMPNEVTFLSVLSSCSHGGLVEEGKMYFERMVWKYGIVPKVEHYGCLVDLLGRAGLLEEAFKLMERVYTVSDATAWRTLLAACRVYGNIELGEQVKTILTENFDEHPSDSLLLSGMYASCGSLSDYAQMQNSAREETAKVKLRKEVGYSKFEMDSWDW